MQTSGNFGLYDATYLSLTASGLTPGRRETTPNNEGEKTLVFNNTGAVIPNNAAVMFDAVNGTATDYDVAPTDTGVDNSPAIGVNDNAGGDIPDQTFFWMSTKGAVNVLAAAGLSNGDLVAPSATAGTLGATGNTQQTNIQLRADSGIGGVTAAYIN